MIWTHLLECISFALMSETLLRNMTKHEHFFEWTYAENLRARVRIAEVGEDTAEQPMLFIHGYGAMIEHWEYNLPAFASERKVYAMDLLGFGDSDKPDAPYGLELWATQIRAFLDLKRIEKVVLVGHSMGGASSLTFAEKHPDRLSSLVLIDASGIFPKDINPLEQMMYRAVGSPFIGETLFKLFANEFGARQSLIPTYFNLEQVTDDLVAAFAKPLRSPGAIHAYLAPSRYPDRFMLDNFPRPSRYNGKVLLIWGEFDQAFPPKQTLPKFQEILPQAELVVIPNTKHCPHHEQADAVNAAIEQFLRRADTRD